MKESSHYFEYGMGGSTCLASRLVKKTVTAIDSDPAWIDNVRDKIKTYKLRLTLSHVDIGKTGGWGTPIGTTSREKFPSYSKFIRTCPVDEIDLCLIDGRFRMACVFEALASLRAEAIIGIHDYAARPQYHGVERFARPIASSQQLSFFIRKPGIPNSDLEAIADSYRYNPE